MVDRDGVNLFRDSIEARKRCCEVRKILPLRRAQLELDAWVCGLRSGQGATRQKVEVAEWDDLADMVKINPLADWDRAGRAGLRARARRAVQPAARPGLPEHRLRARARARSPRARTRAPGAGGGRAAEHRECGLHHRGAGQPLGPPARQLTGRRTRPREPARHPRSQERPHPARGLPLAGQRLHALVDRQGQHRAAAAGAQGLLRPRADPAGAHRHRLQDAGDDRVPRPAGARVAPQPGRRPEPQGARGEGDLPRRQLRPHPVLPQPQDDGAQAHARRRVAAPAHGPHAGQAGGGPGPLARTPA